MTQQVLFDQKSGAVLQWQDTEQFDYAAPTEGTLLLTVTEAQWAARGANAWVISGALTETAPVVTPSLSDAQTLALRALAAGYANAIARPVSFKTTGGVTKTFQADAASVANLQAMLAAFAGGLPSGFYWLAADNTQVPVTLADLQGLGAAIAAQGWAAFQHLQARKAAVAAATTVAAVEAIAW